MSWRDVKMLGCRIWQNYLMPSRLDELAGWFRLSLDRGYKFYSVSNYWQLTDAGCTAPPPRSIVLRHDIDVDLAAARAMFSIEKKLAIAGSYYFRLRTIDLPLVQAIADSGGEASYHYEELATEAKACCLRTVEQVRAKLPMIRQRFFANLERLRGLTGLPMTTVANHGDWANRKLGLANTEILKSLDLKRSAAVQVEAYDYDLLKFVTARYADAAGPAWWTPKRVAQAESGQLELVNDAPKTPAEAVCEGLPLSMHYCTLNDGGEGRAATSSNKLNVLARASRIALGCRFMQPTIRSCLRMNLSRDRVRCRERRRSALFDKARSTLF